MSFSRYPTYKETGAEWAGEVPAHWDAFRLRFAAALNPSKQEIGDLSRTTPVTFLPMEAVGDDGSIDVSRERPLSEVLDGYTYMRDGDVAFAKITPCFENGKGALMQSLRGGIAFGTTELTVLRPREGRTEPKFLHYWISSSAFRQMGEAHMYGAGGQKRVPEGMVRDFLVPMPPVSDQRSIIAFLDRETAKIDALVAEQRRLMDLLREKRQAVISHAVTKGLHPDAPVKDSGVEWLGDVPAHWDVRRVKALCSRISKGTTPTTLGAGFADEGIRFLKAENVTERGVSSEPEFFVDADVHLALSRSALAPRDVLVVIAGATTGKAAVLPETLTPANTNQAVSFLRLVDDSAAAFVCHWINSESVRRLILLTSVQSAQPNLSMEDLGNIPIVFPPPEDIRSIIEWVESEMMRFDQLIDAVGSSVNILLERRAALITAAVTGQIDVRGLAAAEAA